MANVRSYSRGVWGHKLQKLNGWFTSGHRQKWPTQIGFEEIWFMEFISPEYEIDFKINCKPVYVWPKLRPRTLSFKNNHPASYFSTNIAGLWQWQCVWPIGAQREPHAGLFWGDSCCWTVEMCLGFTGLVFHGHWILPLGISSTGKLLTDSPHSPAS